MVVVIDSQVAGISGDMLLSALIDIGAKKSKVIDGIHVAENYLTGSRIQKIDFGSVTKHGTKATELLLDIREDTYERKGIEIQECILLTSDKIGLSEKSKVFAKESIKSLINAESKIHGEPVESVHFHEASSIDTVVDIIGSAIALDDLDFFSNEIVSTPVAIGGGMLNFSHGTVSNPASAILEIFMGTDIIISGGQVKEEITTPTGASLLVNLADRCSEFYPSMKVRSIGYGAGKKNFDGFANVLKIVRGENTNQFQQDTVQILETNLDDVSGEVLGHMIDKVISNGAKDVTVAPAITKKGRPTHLVSIICDSNTVNNILDTLVSETGTLGVRVRNSARYIVPRTIVTVPVTIHGKRFSVKCKIVNREGTAKHFKVESADIKTIAESMSLSFKDAYDIIRSQIKDVIDTK
ncbi:MAG TPA: nickel pincer cofactor biosynthesis protein LarC [Nitrosopumilaceae archaeon]|nr:nickel pincer cofactor biosynthesis protein LarC [Nitrosopumilaceae archaeon]